MKILLSILFWIFWIGLIYIANAIYYVDFNIKNWDESARYVLAFIGVFMGFFISIFFLGFITRIEKEQLELELMQLKNSLK